METTFSGYVLILFLKGGTIFLRINSGNIGMDSARLYKSTSTTRTTFVGVDVGGQWNGDALTSFTNLLSQDENDRENSNKIGPDPRKNNLLSDSFERMSTRGTDSLSRSRDTFSEFSKLHQLMIRHIFELLFGRKNNKSSKSFEDEAIEGEELPPNNAPEPKRFQFVTTTYSASTYFAETESTSFQASGTVQTADGRSIDINLNVSMSRSFASYYETQMSTTNLQICDPLVINYDGNLAELDKEYSFFFDLDTDGQEEKIAKLVGGSGFLSLDKNNDGIINDGSELFGTKSGDGFKDLAAYDEDGNGWIDEGDSIFEKLRIWAKDPEGNDILYTLKDQNIGAIYTGAVDTQFSLNDDTNSAMGYVRKTGLFLYETGAAGTVQHIDLVS